LEYNIIDYYTVFHKDIYISSDPRKYPSGIWALRNYTENGINYDSFCDGYHRAVDLAMMNEDLRPVPTPISGEVVSGTSPRGNFGGTVVVANKDLNLQIIFGHLDRDLPVKVGDTVKKGDIIGCQSNTNYYDNPMAVHLHIQFQPYKYYETEKEFVCSGIDPFNIKLPTFTHKVVKGDTLYSLSKKYNLSIDTIKKLNSSIKNDTIVLGQKIKLIRLEDRSSIPVRKESCSCNCEYDCNKENKVKNYNPHLNKPLSSNYHYYGKIDHNGAAIHSKQKDGTLKPINIDLQPNDEVYIFEAVNGWGRIYTNRNDLPESNRWIYLERMIPIEVK